jgi:MazG family protein
MSNPLSGKPDSFAKLVETMRRLRRECPWDRQQTSQSILPYLIEETYEVVEALEGTDPDEVRAELGDLLLQVLFHSELASERGEFDVYDVIETVREKMIRRHPHVFGDVEARTAEEVLRNWSRIKQQERQGDQKDASVLAGVPASLPALLRAERLGEKASRVGFDWPDGASVLDKVHEETVELEAAIRAEDPRQIEHEIGDALFALASLARKFGVSAEIALRRTLERFCDRFHHIEAELSRQGRDIHATSLADMETLWQEAKRR